jgi:hypothetical protein
LIVTVAPQPEQKQATMASRTRLNTVKRIIPILSAQLAF